MFVATIAVVAIVNVNFGVKKDQINYLTLSTLEAQACCRMEDSNGYMQICHCEYLGTCPCLDGWAVDRQMYCDLLLHRRQKTVPVYSI